MKVFGIIGIIAIIVSIIFGILYFNNVEDLRMSNNLLKASNDTVSIYKNKYKENVYRISSLETENSKQFTQLAFKDKRIQELQDEVSKRKKENLQNIAIIKAYAKIDTTAKTIYVPTEVPTQPIYKWSVGDEWYKATGESTHLKTKLGIEYYPKFVISNKIEKGVMVTEVVDKNPYSVVTDIVSQNTKLPKQKKFGLGVHAGYNPWNGFDVSVGINYNIIELW